MMDLAEKIADGEPLMHQAIDAMLRHVIAQRAANTPVDRL